MRYDALLVRHLAHELDAYFAGQPVHGIELSPDTQRVTIDVGETRLQWNLHSSNGYLGRIAAVLPLEKPLQLPRKARWQRAHALFDERVLIVEIAGGIRPHATSQIVFELLTNQWNALTLDADGKVLRQLKGRATSRDLRRGQVYRPPDNPEARSTASPAEWLGMFERIDAAERPKLFLNRFVYASPLNADAVFAASSLEQAFNRYQELIRELKPHIVLLRDERIPYSHHLWSADAQPQPSLLAACERLGSFDVTEDAVAELARRLYAVDRKIERLQSELSGAKERALATRRRADLLMAYASTITRGNKQITLPDFEGNPLTIDLDAALTPIENAQELYQEARKQQRASERLPKLLQDAEATRRRLLELHERAQQGSLEPADVRALVRVRGPQKQQSAAGEKLPYRRYRTSGGLEVRVGRSARANDELTLQHSSPRDIWLHARHVGGAHVVLRWQDAESNPPLRDIMEAAVLAALHSQARTSRTVPVDYTRRRYVSKRRKSPPGQVMLERAKTVFVEPDAELEEKLRWPEDDLPAL
ncbi:MAG TPA: NFACT RNA binding domain-containing protein [Longimicrobiales bacterium]